MSLEYLHFKGFRNLTPYSEPESHEASNKPTEVSINYNLFLRFNFIAGPQQLLTPRPSLDLRAYCGSAEFIGPHLSGIPSGVGSKFPTPTLGATVGHSRRSSCSALHYLLSLQHLHKCHQHCHCHYNHQVSFPPHHSPPQQSKSQEIVGFWSI